MKRALRKVKRILKRCIKKTKRISKKIEKKTFKTHHFVMKIVKSKSLYPNMKRKSAFKRYFEIYYLYLFEGHGLAKCYNKYGFDIENFHDYHDYICALFLHTNSFRKKNISVPKHNYLSADKFLTYCYLSRFDDEKVPKVINLLNKGNTMFYSSSLKTTKDILENMKNGDKLCFKVLNSCAGKGFYLVEKKKDEVIINNGTSSLDEFYKSVEATKYLVQEYVIQHKKMSDIMPDSLNTLRIVTLKRDENYDYLGTMFRCGSVKGVCVDNACQGGVFVGVNDNGTLKEEGYFRAAAPVKTHPVSGIKFKGYKIPYFDEAVKLCLSYHKLFPTLKSIGWDIAITDKGPMIIEVNVGWQTDSFQMCNGGLRRKIEELYGDKYNNIRKKEEKELKKMNKYR